MATIQKIKVKDTLYDISPSPSGTLDTTTKDNAFASSDVAQASATSWTDVAALAATETNKSMFTKATQMMKNTRYLYNIIGTGFSTSNTIKKAIDGKAASNHSHDLSAMINGLSVGSATPEDADYYVCQYAGGGNTTSTYHRRPMSALWDYIKTKGNSTWQPKGSYAAASHTHTKSQITDFPTSLPASDVYAWAKANTKPSYSWNEITGKPSSFTAASHTHTKSQITDFPSSLKNPTSLTIQGNGTALATYDGSTAKTVNITKSNIGLGNVDNTADTNKSVKFARETYICQYKTVNLTDLDQNTWYPVTGTNVQYNGLRHLKCNVQLNSGSKPSWSTHDSGFTAVVDILEEAYGWGTTSKKGIVLTNDQMFINDSNKPPVGYEQMGNSSIPVWWLRGGGIYFLAADYDCTWTIRKSKYENSSQSVEPKTTYPGVNISKSTIVANLDGTASYANSAGSCSTASKIGTGTVGANNKPVYINGGTPTACSYSLGNACSKSIRTLTAQGSSGWKDATTDQGFVPDMAFMAYWNGAYSGSSSNLTYCCKGAFGTAATKNVGDFAAANHIHLNGTKSGAIDWNTFITYGVYKIQDCTMDDAHHAPNQEYSFGILQVLDSEGNIGEKRILQIYWPHSTTKGNHFWYRMHNGSDINSGWSGWTQIKKKPDNAGYADSAGSVSWGNVTGKPSTFTPASHTHDDRYYTESEINSKLGGKANSNHTHYSITTVADNRSTNTKPNDYVNTLIFQGLKNNSNINSPSSDTYSYLLGLRGWSDASGGNSHELAFNNTGVYWRNGDSTSWSKWHRIYTDDYHPNATVDGTTIVFG